jgi:hypothetical protein
MDPRVREDDGKPRHQQHSRRCEERSEEAIQ